MRKIAAVAAAMLLLGWGCGPMLKVKNEFYVPPSIGSGAHPEKNFQLLAITGTEVGEDDSGRFYVVGRGMQSFYLGYQPDEIIQLGAFVNYHPGAFAVRLLLGPPGYRGFYIRGRAGLALEPWGNGYTFFGLSVAKKFYDSELTLSAMRYTPTIRQKVRYTYFDGDDWRDTIVTESHRGEVWGYNMEISKQYRGGFVIGAGLNYLDVRYGLCDAIIKDGMLLLVMRKYGFGRGYLYLGYSF